MANINNEDEIEIGELLHIVLALQAEVGVISDLMLDTLKTGEINLSEITRALQSLENLTVEAQEMLGVSGSDQDEDEGDGQSENVH